MAINMGTRLAKLETATQKNEFRPLPLSCLYGDPLPDDFHTNPKYIRPVDGVLSDFYSSEQF